MPLGILDIQSAAHSIEIKNASGTALLIDGSGHISICFSHGVAAIFSDSPVAFSPFAAS